MHARSFQTRLSEIKKFWTIDHAGIVVPDKEMSEFAPDVSFYSQRYQVKLPWKIDKEDIELGSNFELCLHRLRGAKANS